MKFTIIGNNATSKKIYVPLTEKELRELKTNLDIFIEEYNEYLDEEYKFFCEILSAKLLRYIHGTQK